MKYPNTQFAHISKQQIKDFKNEITIQYNDYSNMLKKWKIGINSGYDFDRNDLSYTSINLYRDLHCWELLFNLIPLGYHRSYYITLRVKADVLKDLKLERRRDWISPNF